MESTFRSWRNTGPDRFLNSFRWGLSFFDIRTHVNAHSIRSDSSLNNAHQHDGFYCCGARMEDARRVNPICGDSYAELFMNDYGLDIF